MSDTVRPSAHEETRAVGGSALLALVGASLPMNLDPAIHNIAVVAAGNTLHMTGAERSLAASIGTLASQLDRLVNEVPAIWRGSMHNASSPSGPNTVSH